MQSLAVRIPVGDPSVPAEQGNEGPKGIASEDFNGDGSADLAVANLDGTITVLLKQGSGWEPPQNLYTTTAELRSVIAADLDGDGPPDIAAASPVDGQIVVFFNPGSGDFRATAPVALSGWKGVRALASGDFDGDGKPDLAAAGPGMGVRHFRGSGGRTLESFHIMGDLQRLSPVRVDLEHPRPVYAMHTLKSRDGLRDDLLVTHADIPELWILSTAPVVPAAELPVDPAGLPGWKDKPSPVLIHEVQVLNTDTLRDADNTPEPWAELINKSAADVNLAGWKFKLQTAEWTFPNVTIPAGRFLTVFLSGKDRTGSELHTSFQLKQSTDALNLVNPSGDTVHTIDLPQHTVSDVSRGLSPDSDEIKWFDVPSPGVSNNAGLGSIEGNALDDVTTLTITPREPLPGQPVTVRVTMPARPMGSAILRYVWFSASPHLQEVHHLMHRISAGGVTPAVFEEVLPPGSFFADTPHRVLARLLNEGTQNDFTIEVHQGLDAPEGSTAVRPEPGCLKPVASVPSPKVKSFDIGPVTTLSTAQGARADLVYADDEGGRLRIHRASSDLRRFQPISLPADNLPLNGDPRDIKLADTDGDHWMDATVIIESMDLAVTCKNVKGLLHSAGELATGRSPRELVMADFTGDSLADAAVINRESADVSILPSSSSLQGLVSSDQIYPVDGDVGGLKVGDFNDDGFADVLQLHRASAEFSIRFARTTAPNTGLLGPPVFFSLGEGVYGPGAVTIADVNGDLLPDVLVANLGRDSDGSVSVRLANKGGGFAPPQVFNAGAGLFALAVADFNNDGNNDVVAGLWDCRVMFFFGEGNGTFHAAYEAPVPFVIESRVMVTGDFDNDGDIDIAGTGIAGDLVTLTNPGPNATWLDWVTGRAEPQGALPDEYGAERIEIVHLRSTDTDPDLIIGSGGGIIVYEGGPGMDFTRTGEFTTESEMNFAISDVLVTDVTGDGRNDWVAACLSAACISILEQGKDGHFRRGPQAVVPSARYLAAGDLDGDGDPDLVGTGDSLWTVLSSRAHLPAAPGSTFTNRPRETGILINEVLARNTGISVPSDNWQKTDYIELYNNTDPPATMDLSGWRLGLQSNQEGTPVNASWVLPQGLTLGYRQRTLLICAPPPVAPPAPPPPGDLHTGFMLPAEGGVITLNRPDNTEADHIRYPYSPENVSWSRFMDGHAAFRADPIPSPGAANQIGGQVPPEVKLRLPPPSALIPPGPNVTPAPLRFTARGIDDLAILSMSLIWNRLDQPLPSPQRLVLLDDGQHGDGDPVDTIFSNIMINGAPLQAGASVQFFLEVEDISGEVRRLPEGATLTAPGETPVAWTFSISTPAELRIVEVATDNAGLMRDELGDYPDYIKVRNEGSTPIPDLGTFLLVRSPLDDQSLEFQFPAGQSLAPGAEITVFADGDPSQGPLHAAFTLDARGDSLSLLAAAPLGARQWIHSLTIPAMQTDDRFLQLPGTRLFGVMAATDDPENWAGTVWDDDGAASAAVHFRAPPGSVHTIEGDEPGAPEFWSVVQSITANGLPQTVTRELTRYAALRIASNAGSPSIQINAVIPNVTSAGVYGVANGATAVTLYYGRSNAGTVASGWESSMSSAGREIEFVPSGLSPFTHYYYGLRADTSAGAIWSAPGTTFITKPVQTKIPPTDIPPIIIVQNRTVTSLALTRLNPTDAAVEIKLNSWQPFDYFVRIVAGRTDRFGNGSVPPWERGQTATIDANGTWTASLFGLARESEYFVRAVISNAAGQIVSAQRLRFRTPSAHENIVHNLRLTEIMYRPGDPNPAEFAAGYSEEDFEFVELQNASTESMDLRGLWFQGIALDFPPAGAPILPPGGFTVIASNPHAFAMRYGAGIPLAGWTLHPFRNSRLSNNGELITLRGARGEVVFSIDYPDLDPSDGNGRSLEYWAPPGPLREEQRGDFVVGTRNGGSPGQAPEPWILPYADWIPLTFGAQAGNTLITRKDADPDDDGLTNLVEFAFGTHPLIRTPELMRMSRAMGATVLAITAPKESTRSPRATVTLERSPYIGSWIAVGSLGHSRSSYVPAADSLSTATFDSFGETANIRVPSNGTPRREFFRLNVAEH